MDGINNRDRVWKSIRHQEPDRVPWHIGCTTPTRLKLENYYGSSDLDSVLDQHIVKYRSRIPYQEIRPNYVQDEFGLIWDRTIDKDIGVVVDHPLKSCTLKGFTFPNPHDPRRFAALPSFLAANPGRFRLYSVGFSLFERAWTLRGLQNFMMDMYDAPRFVDDLLDAILAYHLEMLDEALKYEIDGVMFGDDWGQQTGLLFGPRLWRRFIKPRIAELYRVTKAARKAVFIHSCGKVQELFPELIELGLDVFNPFQPDVMDPYEIKRLYGRQLCFYGGISVQKLLPFGTPEQIRTEVRHLHDEIGRGGGFIIGPSHDIPGDVPIENLIAMIDTILDQ